MTEKLLTGTLNLNKTNKICRILQTIPLTQIRNFHLSSIIANPAFGNRRLVSLQGLAVNDDCPFNIGQWDSDAKVSFQIGRRN